MNDKREIFGWTMYDWANCAFSTTVVTALLGVFIFNYLFTQTMLATNPDIQTIK